jgi:hypothetical protein
MGRAMSVRKQSKPKKASNGWVVETNFPHSVEGRYGDIVRVPATFVHGHPSTGVWIEDAGVDGNGQHGFKICGHPDFLDDLADTLRALASDVRKSWRDG